MTWCALFYLAYRVFFATFCSKLSLPPTVSCPLFIAYLTRSDDSSMSTLLCMTLCRIITLLSSLHTPKETISSIWKRVTIMSSSLLPCYKTKSYCRVVILLWVLFIFAYSRNHVVSDSQKMLHANIPKCVDYNLFRWQHLLAFVCVSMTYKGKMREMILVYYENLLNAMTQMHSFVMWD